MGTEGSGIVWRTRSGLHLGLSGLAELLRNGVQLSVQGRVLCTCCHLQPHGPTTAGWHKGYRRQKHCMGVT